MGSSYAATELHDWKIEDWIRITTQQELTIDPNIRSDLPACGQL